MPLCVERVCERTGEAGKKHRLERSFGLVFVVEKQHLSLLFSAKEEEVALDLCPRPLKKLYRRVVNKAAPTHVVRQDSLLVCAPAGGWCHQLGPQSIRHIALRDADTMMVDTNVAAMTRWTLIHIKHSSTVSSRLARHKHG